MSTIKPFANHEEKFTRVHNYVLDVVMPRENKSTLCVLLAAIRCTVGWHKESDQISLSQFEQRTGLTRNTVIRAIRTCLDRGYLLRFSDHEGSYYYTLNQEFEAEEAEEAASGSAIIAPEVARLSRPQKKPKTDSKTNKNTTNKKSDRVAQSMAGGGDGLSPQAQLFLEFGISLNASTTPLLEKDIETIKEWMNYVTENSDGIRNPQGRVIAGLRSGYPPPKDRNGSEPAPDPEISAHRARRTVTL